MADGKEKEIMGNVIDLDSYRPQKSGIIVCCNKKCKRWWAGAWPVNGRGYAKGYLKCPHCKIEKSKPATFMQMVWERKKR